MVICARFLNYKTTVFNSMPYGLFIEGDSLDLISRNGDVASNQNRERKILQAILGQGSKDDKDNLGIGVYKQYGKAEEGFNIVSLVSSLYTISLKIEVILHNLLQNISENCKVGGYFIGTCYDGSKHYLKP